MHKEWHRNSSGTRLTLNDFPDLLVWATDRPSYGRLCRLLTLGKHFFFFGNEIIDVEIDGYHAGYDDAN
jgi:hypothetical protein